MYSHHNIVRIHDQELQLNSDRPLSGQEVHQRSSDGSCQCPGEAGEAVRAGAGRGRDSRSRGRFGDVDAGGASGAGGMPVTEEGQLAAALEPEPVRVAESVAAVLITEGPAIRIGE